MTPEAKRDKWSMCKEIEVRAVALVTQLRAVGLGDAEESLGIDERSS